MALNPYITQAAAAAMLTALGTAIDAGTAAVINIYSGTAPANADAALSGNALLAQMTCSGTAFSGISDTGTAARATFNAISPDTSADASGTATFWRLLTQNAGTVILQGTVGTSAADLVLNTTAITAGSQVSITSATIDMPEGA